MSQKRCILYKTTQCDNDDIESSMSPCFQISSNVGVTREPSNGEEYLLNVIQERKNYSAVSKSTNDYSQFARNQSRFVQEPEQATTPEFLLPTKEWQNLQVADFSDVRMYISRLQHNKDLWPKDFKTFKFEETDKIAWKTFFENKQPTLTCVLGLEQSVLDKGLEYLIESLDELEPGDTIDNKTGQWIYAFLACTRQPLLSDTTSILRTLARKCAEIRSHFTEDDEATKMNVMPLNIFICYVARYFRQYDLADPFPPKSYDMEF